MESEGKSPYGITNTEAVDQVMGVAHGRTHVSSLKALTARFMIEEINQFSGITLKYRSRFAIGGSGQYTREVRAGYFEAL